MARAVDSDYVALERYFQQVEEEIGLVFDGLAGSSARNGAPGVKDVTPGRERSTRSASLERSWSPGVRPRRPLSAEQCALLESSRTTPRSRSCAREMSVPWDRNSARPGMSFVRRSRPSGLGRSGSSAPDIPHLSLVGQGCRPSVKRWSDINGNLLNITDLLEHFSSFSSEKSPAFKSSAQTDENSDAAGQGPPPNPATNPTPAQNPNLANDSSHENSAAQTMATPRSQGQADTSELLCAAMTPSSSSSSSPSATAPDIAVTTDSTGTKPASPGLLLQEAKPCSDGDLHPRLELPMSTSTDGGDQPEEAESLEHQAGTSEDLLRPIESNNGGLDAGGGFLPHDISTSSQSEEEDGVFHHQLRSDRSPDMNSFHQHSCEAEKTERFPEEGASELFRGRPVVMGDREVDGGSSYKNEFAEVVVTIPPPEGFRSSCDGADGVGHACHGKHVDHGCGNCQQSNVTHAARTDPPPGVSGFTQAGAFMFSSAQDRPHGVPSSLNDGEQLQMNQSPDSSRTSTENYPVLPTNSNGHGLDLVSKSSSDITDGKNVATEDVVEQAISIDLSSSSHVAPLDASVGARTRMPCHLAGMETYRDSPPRTVADLLSTSSEGSWYSLESPGNETEPGSLVHSLDRKYLSSNTRGATPTRSCFHDREQSSSPDAVSNRTNKSSPDRDIPHDSISIGVRGSSLEQPHGQYPDSSSSSSLVVPREPGLAPLLSESYEEERHREAEVTMDGNHTEAAKPLERVSSESSFESCLEVLSREVSPEPPSSQTGQDDRDDESESSLDEDSVPTYTANVSSSFAVETSDHHHQLEGRSHSVFDRRGLFGQEDTYPQSKSPIQAHRKSKSFDSCELSFLMERDRRRRRSTNQLQSMTRTMDGQNNVTQTSSVREIDTTGAPSSGTATLSRQSVQDPIWQKRPLSRSISDGRNDRQEAAEIVETSLTEVTISHTLQLGKEGSSGESGSGSSSSGEGGRKLQSRRRKTSAVDRQALEELRLDVDRQQKKVEEQDFLADKSPEMQVVVNSSTPVLSRRRPFRRTLSRDRDAGASTSSNSTPTPTPTTTPKVSPRSRPDKAEAGAEGGARPKESLFMDPAMANTWHGPITSSATRPSRPKPRMGLGMVVSESTPLFGDQPGWMTRTGKEGGCHTLPTISRTMLDALHKKFYAFQYREDYVPPYKVVVPQQISSMPPSMWKRRLLECSTLRAEGRGQEAGDDGWRSRSCQSSPRLVHRPATQENSPHLYKKLNLGVQERREAEIEAVEACKWLRAAGFPQYAQMYEDGQFPLEVSVVEGDHDFLDRDSIQSLFRRLQTLNKCAVMKIETKPRKVQEESDEEDPCALSDRWEYQKNVRRWSRREADLDTTLMTLKSSSSRDSVLTDQDSPSPAGDSPVLDSRLPHDGAGTSLAASSAEAGRHDEDVNGGSGFAISPRLRRAASERLKSAKNLLKKMESFKSSRRPQRKFGGGAPIVEISGPVVADQENMQAKIQHLNCVDLSPTSEQGPSSPLGSPRDPLSPVSSPVSSPDSVGDNSAGSGSASLPSPRGRAAAGGSSSFRRGGSSSREASSESQDEEAGNDSSLSEYHTARSRLKQTMDSMNEVQGGVRRNNSDTNLMEIFILPEDHKPGSFPKILQNGYIEASPGFGINYRTGSLNLGRGYSPGLRSTSRRTSNDLEVPSTSSHRLSVYDNIPDPSKPAAAGGRDRTVDTELAAAQHDLDLILSDLFENINGLNRAIRGECDEAEGSSTVVEDESGSDSSPSPSPSHNASRELSQEPVPPVTVPHPGKGGEEEPVVRTLNTSHSSSSAGSLDGEPAEGGAEDHLDTVPRERRDSGVGASLTRESSGRTRLRWPSFQKCHRPSVGSQALQVSSLTMCQMNVLRKLSLLKLTAIMEKYSPTNRTGWNWLVPRFMKRSKMPDYSDRAVFGVPLQVIQQRTGQPLPQCILAAMKYLRRAAPDCVGIFRKSGVRSRIQNLRQQLEEHPEQPLKFEELQAYDVADLLKQFFRELPECLLTNKLSDTFFSIFTNVPENLHMEAVQAAVVLLPDENREVLQSLLCFLYDITETADEHQMTAKNLAVCFAPSLFNMYGGNKPIQGTPSPRRQRKNPSPTATFPDQPSAHLCLAFLIAECKKIFMISPHISNRLMNSCKDMEPSTISSLFRSPHGSGPDYKAFGEECIQTLLKECHEKNRGWVQAFSEQGVEVTFKKPTDNYPLREWKCTVEIEAPPVEVLNHIMHERHVWDEDLQSWSVVHKLDKNADVFQYSISSMAPHPPRHYVILRYWRTDLSKGACAVVASSVDHSGAPDTPSVRALLLSSYFLVEPCGSGRSRLTHICRDDMRGRSVEWYNKVFGHICAHYVDRIRETLKPRTAPDGPETKV